MWKLRRRFTLRASCEDQTEWLILRILLVLAIGIAPGLASAQDNDDARRRESLEAFAKLVPVLQHPRCLNCHTSGPFPRQGDIGRRHGFGVVRGPDDKGASVMRCLSCHQEQNTRASGTPGAPHWQLAPLSMGWEGKSASELCRALTDMSANGGRDAAALAKHMKEDPLVQWAWTPGGNRSAPPVLRDDFHALVQRWADTGAACPQ